MGTELMTMNGGGMQMTIADPAAIAAAETARQKVQAAYIVAMHRPRNVEDARIKILNHCKRPLFAEKVEYSKPIGKTKITGPSIRFAECALREWGNILSDAQVVYEDDKMRRIKVVITDLETNATFTKEMQISKTVERKSKVDRNVISERTNTYGEKVYLVSATDEELAIKEAAAISKAIRNEGLRVIPTDIIEEALEIAKKTLADKDSKDPDAAKRKVLDAFHSIGIDPKDLEKYLKHSINTLSPPEVNDLRGVYAAISSGEAKWNDYVNPPVVEPEVLDGTDNKEKSKSPFELSSPELKKEEKKK